MPSYMGSGPQPPPPVLAPFRRRLGSGGIAGILGSPPGLLKDLFSGGISELVLKTLGSRGIGPFAHTGTQKEYVEGVMLQNRYAAIPGNFSPPGRPSASFSARVG